MIIDSEYKKIPAAQNVTVEGFGDEEIRKTAPLVRKFVRSYMSKTTSDADWLAKTLAENLPNKSPEEIFSIAQEISGGVAKFDEIFAAGQAARMRGLTPQEWIADNLQTAAVGLSVQDFGDRLAKLDAAIHHGNEELARTLTTKSGSINMNPNLDGLLAESLHANSFNRAATLSNKPLEARVLHSNVKNSPDIGIYDKTTGKLAQRYQLKNYSDAQKTITAINAGGYPPNQNFIVPTEQLAEVRKACPNKKISDRIEVDGVTSEPLTKSDIKNLQQEIQGGKEIPANDWTTYDTRDLALHLGKEIAFSAASGAAIGAGFGVAKKILSGEEIQADEVLADALKAGADEGLKTAVAAALKVAAESNYIPALAKISARIPNLACNAVETIKIIGDYLRGEISGEEAVERLLWLAASGYVFELVTGGLSAAGLGATILTFVPVIFSPLGVAVVVASAIAVGVMAFGDTLLDCAGSFFETTGEILSDIWVSTTTVAEGIGNAIGGFVGWLLD